MRGNSEKKRICSSGSKLSGLRSATGLGWYRHSVRAGPRSAIGRAPVSYWRKYVHEVLVNRLGGLSLPRKSVVRLTDRPDMALDVYRGSKTTIQQQQQHLRNNNIFTKVVTLCQMVNGGGEGRGVHIRMTSLEAIHISSYI